MLVARDRNKQVFDECQEQAGTDTLLDLLKNRIKEDSVSCSDGFLLYSKRLMHTIIDCTCGWRLR
ncbi:hypothetical protein SVI_2850 [Shewanella violacea DSS12]|uniref:Uncharacterized protein n=1 Tax=Shewanella violacea (strain JCM 10179 / CIP 106290 / LMG 19151 / DSS12) TaxID=637905 RepID=D4ZMC2_SHEVD|nr:hypothetical protein SVI_2850 [Shewanella violacea DSS12]